MKYYSCPTCGSLEKSDFVPYCNEDRVSYKEITEHQYLHILDELKTGLDVDDDITSDIILGQTINPDMKDQLRYCRTVISGLLEQCWEMGGYTLGENEFENLSVIKDAREQLKEIEELLK